MNPDDGTPVPRPSSPPVREQPSSPPVREQAAADKDAISTPERQAVSTTIPVDRSVDLETAAQTYEQRAEDIGKTVATADLVVNVWRDMHAPL